MHYFDGFTRIGRTPDQHPAAPGRLSALLEELRHCSIEQALVWSIDSVQFDGMWANRRLCNDLAQHPHLAPIWNVHPHHTGEMPPPDDLVAELADQNVRAVTIHPALNQWNVLSRASNPLFETLQKARILTMVQPLKQLRFDELEALLQRYPELPLLARGVGWGLQKAVFPLLEEYKNLHITFDSFQVNLGIETLVDKGCADQLLFCSNALSMAAGAARAFVDYADVPEPIRAKIAGGNLCRITGLDLAHGPTNDAPDPIMAEAAAGQSLSTTVLDFHAHILPEGLQGGGRAHTMKDGGPRGIKRLADRMGVDGIGFMSWCGATGPLCHDGNQHVLQALEVLPESYWGLVTIHPRMNTPEQFREKFGHYFDNYPRMYGMKPYPFFGHHYDTPTYAPWWEICHERGLYGMLHANRWDLTEFDELCPKYPNAHFFAAHCGMSYDVADAAIERARKYPNFFAEITYTSSCCGIIDYLVEGCGVDRVFYGTDLPMRDPRPQFGWVVYSKLSIEQKRQVLGGNAHRILARFRENKRRYAAGEPVLRMDESVPR